MRFSQAIIINYSTIMVIIDIAIIIPSLSSFLHQDQEKSKEAYGDKPVSHKIFGNGQ